MDTPLVATLAVHGLATCSARAPRGDLPVAACWPMNPMNATIARRPFLSSLSFSSSSALAS